MTPTRQRTNRADVMISSTSLDLPEHRKAVMDAILRLRMFPLAMESGSAVANSNAIKFSLNMVDEAEVYVGIFGFRYGYTPVDATLNPHEKSVTELEYRRAMDRKIPVLIYIMGDEHPVLPKEIDKETSKVAKLTALKDELQTNHIVGFFNSIEELRSKVLQSLYELRDSGLIDVDSVAVVDDDPAIPQPPALYSVPPYILTNTFVGREAELNELNAWAQSDKPIMVIDAIGGMGKSALTWEWVTNPEWARAALPNLKGIFWWSFYERGATMESFLRHALAYITRRNPGDPELKGMKYEERASQLLTELQRAPYLLVLDGFERVLVAYHRWNAAQMRDEEVGEDAPSPPVPLPQGEGSQDKAKETDPNALRACTDPRDAEILQRLLAAKPSKILLSSRLMPRALEDEHDPLPGVLHKPLKGLSVDDAYRLMTERGVKAADRGTLNQFMNSFGCHSLLLKMVAGRIKNYRRASGNFDEWYAAEGKELHLADMDIKQKHSHILQYAFEGLDATKRKLLSQVAAFNDAVNYDTLSVFNPYLPTKPDEVRELDDEPIGLWMARYQLRKATTDLERIEAEKSVAEAEAQHALEYPIQKAAYDAYLKALDTYPKSTEYRAGVASFDMALTELEERGLLQWDRADDSYDLHPVVRGYSFDQLEQTDKVQAYDRIRSHFESLPPENAEKATEVEDLKNTIEMYRMLLGAGKLDEAARFWGARLSVLLFNLNANHTVLELLRPLFGDGLDKLPTLTDRDQQSYRTQNMATVLTYLGRNDEALLLQGLTLKLDLERKDAHHLGVGLSNYSNSLRSANQLAASLRCCELARELAEATGNADNLATAQLRLLGLYRGTGDWAAAEAAYAAFTAHPPSYKPTFWQGTVEQYRAEMLLARGLDAREALDKAEALAQRGNNALGFRQLQRWRGEAALAAGKLDEAVNYFQEALRLAHKAGAVETATYMGCVARVRAKQNHTHEALSLIAEALLQPYKEDVHDLNNSIAETYLTLGDHAQAKTYAIDAYKWAWADGPPYSWWWGLERAKKMLDALGEPYPDMSPFDPAKVEPIPYEDEIRAFIAELKAEKAAEAEGEGDIDETHDYDVDDDE